MLKCGTEMGKPLPGPEPAAFQGLGGHPGSRWPRPGALGAASPDAIGPAGEMLPKPRAVRYDTEMAYHLLRWEPGHDAPSNVSYEVEHIV